MQTVAMAVRTGVGCDRRASRRGRDSGARIVDKTDMIAPRGRLTLRVTALACDSDSTVRRLFRPAGGQARPAG